MSNAEINLDAEIRIWQEKLFSPLHPAPAKTGAPFCADRLKRPICNALKSLRATEQSVADSENWAEAGKTTATQNNAAESLRYSLQDKVIVADSETLPFEDASFDRVIIIDALKGVGDDHEFIHECHRVLKNDGWVVISESRRTPLSPATPPAQTPTGYPDRTRPAAQWIHRG